MANFPHIEAVLQGPIPDLVQAQWVALAGEHADTGFYGSALAFERLYPFEGSRTAVAVINSAPYAAVLEEGHAGFHLASKIDWSAAVARGTAKVTKSGKRFLRIPFQHGSPVTATGGASTSRLRNAMTRAEYREARALFSEDEERRKLARARLREAGTWMSRAYSLPSVPPALRAKAEASESQPGYTWRARSLEGLTRKEHVGAGGVKSSTYLTFRTLTEDSAGWFVPPFAGYRYAERTVDLVREQVRDLVEQAARADVESLIRLRIGGQSA